MEKTQIIDYELAEDLHSFLAHSPDAVINKSLKSKIEKMDPDMMIEVTKLIGGPIEIIAVREVDDDLLGEVFN